MARRKSTEPYVPSLFAPRPADKGDVAASASSRGDAYKKIVFTGGMDRSLPPNMIPEDSARLIRNMWYPKEQPLPITRPGLENLLTAAADGAITAIKTYDNPVDGKTYIVFTNMNSGGTDQEIQFVEVGQTTADDLEDPNGVAETVGSLKTPALEVFDGSLILGVESEPIRVWSGNLTAALASYNFHAASDVDAPNDTIDIGGGHSLAVNDQVMVASVTVVSPPSTGVLPSPLVANTRYYVQNVAGGLIKLASALGGSALDLVDGSNTCRVYKLPACAKGKVTISAQPTAGQTLTVGGFTWTFEDARTAPFEITRNATANTQAQNIVDAINTDSYEVSAVRSSAIIYVTARATGSAGNSYALSTNATGVTVDIGFCGGVNGQALDSVTTYEAPTDSAVVTSDKNGRLVVAGPETARVYFSTPNNEWLWASGVYGEGEYWDLGSQENNKIVAIEAFGRELWAHKYGENREIHRMQIADPIPASWDITTRFFTDTSAAVAARCAVSALDKHVVLDKTRIHVFTGTDTTDEYRSLADGTKVFDLMTGTSENGFIAKDPENLVLYIFQDATNRCLVYHYGSSRWTQWTFGVDSIHCATYCEALGAMLFGGSDGHIYTFNSRLVEDTDGDSSRGVTSTIIGRTYETDDLTEIQLKQTLVDYTNKLAGVGRFALAKNRVESISSWLFSFNVNSVDYSVEELGALGYIAVIGDFSFETASAYAKNVSYEQDNGTAVAPYLEFTGAVEVNRLALRVAQHGREQG